MSDIPFYRRNPPSPPMAFFDDTAVTVFEIALSLEMQNAFKQDDISFLSLPAFLHITLYSTFGRSVLPSWWSMWTQRRSSWWAPLGR